MTTLYLSPARFPESTRVRSYDFEGRRDCYVEGTVESYASVEGCLRYVIHVERTVFGGKESSNDERVVYPPVNGTPTWSGRTCNGVERLP